MKGMISIVIPVYNEENNILPLYDEIKRSVSGLSNTCEILFVDDGSIDKSVERIKEVSSKDPSVRGIVFSRNYGQTAAISAGIEAAKGEYIVTMDADLQNDPADIGMLVRKVDEGYDLVSGWRRKRKEPFFSRRLPSITANRIISAVTGLRLHDYGCTLKIYKRELIKNINLYGEMHRFIPLYIQAMGGEIGEVEVNHRERASGRSKYGINRTFKVVLDLITVKFLMGASSTSPLYFFGRWGFLLIFSGVLCGVVALIQKIAWGFWVHRNPLLILGVFSFMLGAQAILMGLLAELSIRIYYESTKKTTYFVRERINL